MLISDYSEYLQLTLSSRLFEYAYKRIFSSVSLGEHGYQYNKHALIKLPVIKPNNRIKINKNNVDRFVYDLYQISPDEIVFIESEYLL